MQSLLRNPIASPFTLGISQAAAFGAALAVMLLGTGVMRSTGAAAVTITNPYLITTAAFVCCLLTTGVLTGISKRKRASPLAMVLTGVALGALFRAATMFLQFFADDVQLAAMVFWTFGDVGRTNWQELLIIMITVTAAVIFFITQRWHYNALEAGNETARLTVFDAVLLGRHPHIRSRITEKDILVVNAILERLSLQELALRYIDQLSGGELQKVCLARALVQEPELLLLDEPTSSLDLKNQVEILRLVRRIVDGHTVSAIISLHDINMAIHYADRIIFLKDGNIHAFCGNNQITREIIRDVYDIDVIVHYTKDYPIVIPVQY